MKFYSEKLNKLFDTIDELHAEEKKYDDSLIAKNKLSETKRIRAKEIEDAYKNVVAVRDAASKRIQEADNRYNTLVDNFIKDFGSYHFTYNSENRQDPVTVSDTIDQLYNSILKLPFIW